MTNIKTKDLVKTVDTQAIKDKADCFKRGDDWYEVEPKWDRRVDNMNLGYETPNMWGREGHTRFQYYKEFEVSEDGYLIDYVRKSKYKYIENKYCEKHNHIKKLEERIFDLKFVLLPIIFVIGMLVGLAVFGLSV